MPGRAALGLLLALVGVATAGGCDSPKRSTVKAWPPGEALVAGDCKFLLTKATLYHSNAWHLEVELEAENTSPQPLACGFDAKAMGSDDEPLTEAASRRGHLDPGERWRDTGFAKEAKMTGLSSGRPDGVWIHVEVYAGQWPLGESAQAVVQPEFIRPP